MPAELLAVVEVDWEDRVRCQAPGCGHAVHKSVHVVRDGGDPMVLGSTCSARLFGFARAHFQSAFGGSGGRRLTPEERLLLVENTEALLAQFAGEARVAEELRERKRAEDARARAPAPAPYTLPPPPIQYEDSDRPWTVEDGERAAREWERAKHEARAGDDFAPERLRSAMDEVRAAMRAQGVREELIARESFVLAQARILLAKRQDSV